MREVGDKSLLTWPLFRFYPVYSNLFLYFTGGGGGSCPLPPAMYIPSFISFTRFISFIQRFRSLQVTFFSFGRSPCQELKVNSNENSLYETITEPQ